MVTHVDVGRVIGQHLEVGVALERGDVIRGQGERQGIGIAVLDELAAGRVLGDDANEDLVELAAVPALVVVGEPLEDDAVVGNVFGDAIRAAAGGVVLEPLVGKGVLLGLVGFHSRRVDDEGTVLGGHRRQEERLRTAEVEADRRRVDDLHLLRVLDEPADHVDRAATLEQEAGEGGLDRLGVARRSVVEDARSGASVKV